MVSFVPRIPLAQRLPSHGDDEGNVTDPFAGTEFGDVSQAATSNGPTVVLRKFYGVTSNRPEPVRKHEIASPDSETMLLATLLQTSHETSRHGLAMAHKILGLIADDHYHLKEHQHLSRLIRSAVQIGLSIDLPTIYDLSVKNSVDIGSPEYLRDLVEDPLVQSLPEHAIIQAADRVKDCSVRRWIDGMLDRMRSDLPRLSSAEAVARLYEEQETVRGLSASNHGTARHIAESVATVLEQMTVQAETGKSVATSTGYENVDAILADGFRDEEYILIGARPSMGKTALMLGLGRNIAVGSLKTVLMYSLEMTSASLAMRLMASESKVSLQILKRSELTDAHWNQVGHAIHRFSENSDTGMRLYIDDTPGLSMSEIRSRSRQFAATHGPIVIFVDYLQKVSPERNPHYANAQSLSDGKHVSQVSAGMKLMARELKAPVVALTQLNRELEKRASKRPILSDLRESGSLEQDADIVIFLYRDAVYNPDTQYPTEAELIVAKNRDGPIGMVKLDYLGDTGRFVEATHWAH